MRTCLYSLRAQRIRCALLQAVLPGFLWLWMACPLLWAQDSQSAASTAGDSKSVLIRLHEQDNRAACPKGAEAPSDATAEAKLRECDPLQVVQDPAFTKRLVAVGAVKIEYYPAANMLRANVPSTALEAIKSDPAVIAVFPAEAAVVEASAGAIVIPASPDQTYSIAPSSNFNRTSSLFPSSSPNFSGSLLTPNYGYQFGFQSRLLLPPPPTSYPVMAPVLPAQTWQAPVGIPAGTPFTPQWEADGPWDGGGGTRMSGMLTGLAGNIGVTMLSMRGGTLGLVGGLAGSFALNLLSSRNNDCKVTVSPASVPLPSAGGNGTLQIHAPRGCTWETRSDSDWIEITEGSHGTGSGVVKYKVSPAALNEQDRSGSIKIGNVRRGAQTKSKAAMITQSSGQGK
jgi:hypothetical protein